MDNSGFTSSSLPETKRLEELQRRLLAFPPDGEATWAIFRDLSGLCETCFQIAAPPGSGWAAATGFRTVYHFSHHTSPNAHAAAWKDCPLCRAILQAYHKSEVCYSSGKPLRLEILSPSHMAINKDDKDIQRGLLPGIISLRKGQI